MTNPVNDFLKELSRATGKLIAKIEMADHFGVDKSGISYNLIEKLETYLSYEDKMKAIERLLLKRYDSKTREKILVLLK